MASPKIGTQQEWAAARAELLLREEEHKRLSDERAQQRRELPWVAVEKEYRLAADDPRCARRSSPTAASQPTRVRTTSRRYELGTIGDAWGSLVITGTPGTSAPWV